MILDIDSSGVSVDFADPALGTLRLRLSDLQEKCVLVYMAFTREDSLLKKLQSLSLGGNMILIDGEDIVYARRSVGEGPNFKRLEIAIAIVVRPHACRS